ncbi:hypothetical protein B4U79_10120 [Dinothrombium tinctorium]|uniref:Neurotransmitter-gated ion-channel ligand-binding domain-containing protein n=1 Tax=Dinothrombium tinctorium TaxID=1965070 RepID=A0A443QL03_9ACAR|nr:hypothetical protein B4U79_10120 [Dinothrombium tinctorium]
MYFRQFWNDPRLRFSNREVNTISGSKDFKQRIWTPDTFIVNAHDISSYNVPNPQIFVKINSNGDVLMSERLKASIKCFQEINKFPCDMQHCELEIESYAYKADTIRYDLTEMKGSDTIVIPNFEVRGFTTENKIIYLSNGNYSRSIAGFDLQRSINDQDFLVTSDNNTPAFYSVLLSKSDLSKGQSDYC